jgi:hypothetical protein
MKNTSTLLLAAMMVMLVCADIVIPNYSPKWISNFSKHATYVGVPGAYLFASMFIPGWIMGLWLYAFWYALFVTG